MGFAALYPSYGHGTVPRRMGRAQRLGKNSLPAGSL
jgi:hypothetical protein